MRKQNSNESQRVEEQRISKNEHIEEYLNYYIGLEVDPKFAVLLKGEWGVGKTWFINNFREGKDNSLYVSLNGVSSFKEIEDAFFQQLHPRLASKGMKLVGKIFKGVLKKTINFDWNGDDKSDATANVSISGTDISDFLRNIENKILIFDDLERCSIEMPNILGYINHFVEEMGLKVIIIGNEEEILKDEEHKKRSNSKKYSIIKEKLIGKSFSIQSDFDLALYTFIEELSYSVNKGLNLKEQLHQKEGVIKQLYEAANYNNLRHLRQTILDFERFSEFMPHSAYEKKVIFEHILNLFFATSFELKKGEIIENEIEPLLAGYNWFKIAGSRSEEEDKIEIIQKKYNIFKEYNHPINSEILKYFFKIGKVEKSWMDKVIRDSIYFQDENTPGWKKLLNGYFKLDDEVFDNIVQVVLNTFENEIIEDKHEVMYTTDIILVLNEKGLISRQKESIIDLGKKHLEYLNSKGKLISEKNDNFPFIRSLVKQYLGVKKKIEVSEFEEFKKYTKELVSKANNDDLPRKALSLLDILDNSFSDFNKKIFPDNPYDYNYYKEIPVFFYFQLEKFIDIFFKLKNEEKFHFVHIFQQRYSDNNLNFRLKLEKEWLINLQEELAKRKNDLSGKVSGEIIIDYLLPVLSEAIKKLNNATNIHHLN